MSTKLEPNRNITIFVVLACKFMNLHIYHVCNSFNLLLVLCSKGSSDFFWKHTIPYIHTYVTSTLVCCFVVNKINIFINWPS